MRSGVVLAGGASTRMGAFKPLLPLRGRPLLAYAVDALAPHCDEVLVMAGPRAAEVSRVATGCRVLADPGAGPHVALLAAARVARHPRLVVAPADAPRLTPDVYAALLDAGPDAVAREGAGVNPLVSCWAREGVLRAAPGARSLQEVARALGAVAVDVPEGLLVDVDTPADLPSEGTPQPGPPVDIWSPRRTS